MNSTSKPVPPPVPSEQELYGLIENTTEKVDSFINGEMIPLAFQKQKVPKEKVINFLMSLGPVAQTVCDYKDSQMKKNHTYLSAKKGKEGIWPNSQRLIVSNMFLLMIRKTQEKLKKAKDQEEKEKLQKELHAIKTTQAAWRTNTGFLEHRALSERLDILFDGKFERILSVFKITEDPAEEEIAKEINSLRNTARWVQPSDRQSQQN